MRGVLHCCISVWILSLLLHAVESGRHRPRGSDADAYTPTIFPGPQPHFRVVPRDQTVTSGDRYAQFHCVPAGAKGVTVEWEIVTPEGEIVVGDKHRVSKDGTRLQILEPMEFCNGFEVHCYLVSAHSKEHLKATAKLFVRQPQPPKIVERPRSGKYKRGSRIVLECAAHGWPLPKIHWVFISRHQKVKRYFDADGEYRDFIKETNRLIILGMSPHTEGTYVCIASSSQGHAKVHAHVGFDRRNVKRPNMHYIVHTLRGVHRNYADFARDAQHKMKRKATCNLEVMNQFSWLPSATRYLDGMTLTYDYLVNLLNQQRHENRKSLPGEALDINISLLQYIKANLNCSSTSVPRPDCHTHSEFLQRYASADGSCNNLKHPEWGQAGRGFQRLLQSQYEGGINLPQGYQPHRLYYGFPKPSSRKVSVQVLLNNQYPTDASISQMFNVFGQFVDHDIDLTPAAATDRGILYNTDCNKHCRVDLPCFPIPVPRDDPRVKGCLTFKRSAAFCASGEFNSHEKCIRPREQINQITSVLDASTIYGSSCEVMNQLRDLNSPEGFLKTSAPAPGQKLDLLPIMLTGVPTACGRNSESPDTPCYSSGDARTNEFALLTAQHTMLMREHNRIGHVLHSINPHWCPDKVFFETRRIMSALLQHITFNEYLPVMIGRTGMRELVKPYKGYRPNVNPAIANAFATNAFRIGHTMISDAYAMLNSKYQVIETLRLERLLFAPHVIAKNGIDSLVRGAITVAMKSRQRGAGTMAESIVQRLFELTSKVAADLAALNMQRAKDHGLPSYNHWRSFCGLKWAKNWEDLAAEIPDKRALKALKKVFGAPGNIDLFAGLVVEEISNDALIGPTSLCIIAKQFKMIRDGDRHWFENPGEFTPDQVSEIRQYTFSRLICNTVETINHIQKDAFFLPRTHSDLVPCNKLADLDLGKWKDFDNHHKKCIPASPCGSSAQSGGAGEGPEYRPQ